MKFLATALTAFLLMMLPMSDAEAAVIDDPVAYTLDEAASEMMLDGTSNVGRDWEAEVTDMNGSAEIAAGEAFGVEDVRLNVSVEGIHSDQGSVEDKIHDALEINRYPTIFFRADAIEIPEPPASEFVARAIGELIVAGERKNVEIEATGLQEDEAFRFQGTKDLNMEEDFDVDPPTAMLGALRAAPEVTVTFDVLFVPEG